MTPFQTIAGNIRDTQDIVWRQRFLIVAVFGVLMAVAMLVMSKVPTKYQAGADVLIVNGNERNDPTLSSVDLPAIVGSTVVLERVRHDLRISVPLSTIKRHLTAKPPAYKSGIMRIQYSDTDRERAALVTNGIADELVRYYSELSTERYDKDLRALDQELDKQKKRLENIDTQLRAQGGALAQADERDGSTSGGSLNALESQRALADADLQGDIAHARASTTSRRDILAADPVYQHLQASLTKAATELADARAQYTAAYPGLPTLQGRVDSLKTALAQEADRALSSSQTSGSSTTASSEANKAQADVEADRAKVNALTEEVSKESTAVGATSELDTLRLARDDVLREYQSLAARRASSVADRADALSLGSLEVVSRALPSEAQAGAGRTLLILIAAFVISIIAFGSALLADHLDPRLQRVSQIEALYGKPLIASLKAPTGKTKALHE